MYTVEQVTEAIETVVRKAGEDYIYPPALTGENCMYQDRYGGCIVGRVIKRLHPQFDFNPWEGEPAHELPVDTEGNVLHALSAAQDIQDRGMSWGAALREYKEYLRSMRDAADF